MIDAGTVIDDRYVVERTLASGGMGTVLVVRHETLDSLHALKILHVPGREVRERLITEGKVQARLKHPNIVAVTDTLMVDGAPGIVMEFVAGGSLDELLGERTLSLDEVEALFLGILRGVAHAHAQGLVHRDLKPANVLIERLGEDGLIPKVTDFGIVKVLSDARPITGAPRTRTGIGMGTPQYMAPEQADGASRVGPEADVFSLGCILYEMVIGQRPFESQSVLGILASAADGMFEDPEDARPDLPPRFIRAIRGALVPERDLRIGSCVELAAILTVGRITSLTSTTRSDEVAANALPREFPRGLGRLKSRKERRRSQSSAPPREAASETMNLDDPPGGAAVVEESRRRGGGGWLLAVGGMAALGVVGVGLVGLLGVGVGMAAWWQVADLDDTGDTAVEPRVIGTTPNGITVGVAGLPVDTDPAGDTDAAPDDTTGSGVAIGTPTTPSGTTASGTAPSGTTASGTAPSGTTTSSGTPSGGTPASGTISSSTTSTGTTPPSGTTSSGAPWTLRVTGARTAERVGHTALKYPARNGHLLLVDVSLTNDTPKSVSPLAPWVLVSGGGRYEPSAACSPVLRDSLTNSVDVRAGKTVTGTICFDVPTTVTGGRLGFVPVVSQPPAAWASVR